MLAQNGPAATWGYCSDPCSYSPNPGGVVFGGQITVGSPLPPPPGAVRIRPFACKANGGQTVLEGAPLYLSGGFLRGTHGLVRAVTQADATTISEQRGGLTATRAPTFGPVYGLQPGLWKADWVPVVFDPLGVGHSATFIIRFAVRHTITDLVLPWADVDLGLDDDGTGLQCFDHYRDEVVVVTRTATGQ